MSDPARLSRRARDCAALIAVAADAIDLTTIDICRIDP